MAEQAKTPERVVELFTELMSKSDLDGVMELYDENATFKPSGQAPITGTANIRAALQGLAGLKPKFDSSIKGVVRNEDTALVVLDWSMTGTAPDGQTVSQGGVSADIVRRQADGTWKILLDVPEGTALTTG